MGFFDKLKRGVAVAEENALTPKAPGKKKEAKKVIEKEKKEKPIPVVESREVAPQKEKRPQVEAEGQLAIDLYETDEEFVIYSTIAGVKPEDLEITVENGMVTIKGSRQKQVEEVGEKYYYRECYWGNFSRQVILPEEVDSDKTEAVMKDGVLILRIPKAKKIKKRKITVKQEE